MSLASRIAVRVKAAIVASPVSTPRDPLLFLYPSWIRNSSTASPGPLQQAESYSEPAAQQNTVLITKHNATLSEDPAALDNESITASDNDQQVLKTKETSTQSRPPSIITEDGIACMQQEQSTLNSRKPQKTTERMVRKLLGLQADNVDAKQYASSIRESYRQEIQSYVPDWRKVLSTLVKHTPDHGPWLSKVLKFVVPEGDAPRLLFGIDDHFIEIGAKYGCQMDLGSRDEYTQRLTSFIISGSATSISKCAAEILSIAPSIKIIPCNKDNPNAVEDADGTEAPGSKLPIFDSGVQIRNVSPARQGHNRYKGGLQLRPEDIERPQKWTHVSLLEYVRDLTNSHVKGHVNKFGLQASEDHQTTTVRFLRDLFKDAEVRPSLTREACNEVLKYWVRTNRISDARILFVHMEILKLRMNPETFNILLAGAANFEDIHNFHFILQLMLNRGFVPNGRTWVHFMRGFSDVNIQLHILAAMRKKGLLTHPQTMIEVSSLLAPHEIEYSLDKNQTQEDFIADMDSRYGEKWLSVNTTNIIIRSLAARGLISRCVELYHFMTSRHVRPDRYGVHNILHQCNQAANMEGAIELLRSLPSEMEFRAGEETYRIMFDLAWRLRFYNVAKVVWRYACLSGSTSLHMRNRVWTSMQVSNWANPPTTGRERWKRYAGAFIMGISDITEHPSRYLERLLPRLEFERLHRRVAKAHQRTPYLEDDLEQQGMSDREEPPSIDMPTFSAIGSQGESEPMAQTSDQSSFSPVRTQDESDPEEKDFDQLNDSEQSESKALQLHQRSLAEIEAHQRDLAQRALPQILVPWGPSWVGKKLPAYKRIILKEILEADLEMFKQWRLLRPFEDMLVEAMKMDVEWKRDDEYRERDLSWFMDGRAVRVSIATRSPLVSEFEWI